MTNTDLNTPVFTNPNDDKSVKATEKLNFIANNFRKDTFYKRVEREGFELNYIDFKWEWIINFKDTGAFMALNERGKNIYLYAYKYDEDLNPTVYKLRDFKTKHISKIVRFIKTIYYKIK